MRAISIGRQPRAFHTLIPALLAQIPAGMSLEMRSALTPQEAQPAQLRSNFSHTDVLFLEALSSLRPSMEPRAIWRAISSGDRHSKIGIFLYRRPSNSMNEFQCSFAGKYSTFLIMRTSTQPQ